MLKRIVVCLIIACLLLGLTGCAGTSLLYKELTDEEFAKWTTSDDTLQQVEAMLGLKNMQKVASADGLSLYINKLTTEIAVQTKDGTVWYSNPQQRLGYNQNHLGIYSSQLLVTQIDKAETISVVNNFDQSVQYGQFLINNVDNGVEVSYLFGKKPPIPLYPQAMTIEKFEEILKTIKDSGDQYKFKKYYGLMNLDTVDKSDKNTIDAIKEKYTKAEELRQLRVLKNSPSRLELKNITKYLTEAGFTEADRVEQEKLVGYVEPEKTTPYYSITVVYTLKDGKLYVDVPTDKITTSTENIKIQGIEVLPHWNTANGLSSTNMIIPDGSGAIVEMNKRATTGTSEYMERFYGKDYAKVQKNGTSNKYNLYFPVYGITNADGAMYGVIDSSAASAYLRIEPCTNIKSTPGYGGFYFQLLDIEEVHMDENDVITYSNKAVLDPISINFTFLPKSKNTWVDIAQDYKGRLEENKQLPDAKPSEKVPVSVEFLGAIDDIKTVAGVPTEYIVPLTTFKEAKAIADDLNKTLSSNQIVYQYDAWTKGGMKSKFQNAVRAEGKLGKLSDLQTLADSIKESGGLFYPLVDLQYVYRNTLFDGFSTTSGATRGIMREASFKADFNISNFMADPEGFYGYLVSPKTMKKSSSSLLDSYAKKLSVDGIGLTYMATDLSSDYNRDNFVTRNQAADDMVECLSKASEKYSVLSRGANFYALSNLDVATEVAMNSNASPLISYSVPFTQMLLSGTMTYTADVWNLAADSKYYTLQCIETGSAPNFIAISEDNSKVKYTKYDQFYNVKYDTIKDSIQEVTSSVTDALSDVYGAKMVGYERLNDLVVKVSYDNGHSVYVNYGTKDFKTSDGTIAAGSYLKA